MRPDPTPAPAPLPQPPAPRCVLDSAPQVGPCQRQEQFPPEPPPIRSGGVAQASFDAAPRGRPEAPPQAPKKLRVGRWTERAQKAGARAPGVATTQMPVDQKLAHESALASAGSGLAVFSWFAGIGVCDLTLKALGLQPQWSVAWESDPGCQEVLRMNCPGTELREDVLRISATELAGELRERSITQVLLTAGAPCPDFSRIKDEPAGRQGQEGRKFDASVDILHDLGREFSGRITFLFENVVAKDSELLSHFNQRLGVSGFVVEAADVGIIRRPRLWWSNGIEPGDDCFRWGTYDGMPRAFLDAPRLLAGAIPTGLWQFDPAVVEGKALLPCLSTPAPSAEGRSAPIGSLKKASKGAVERWKKGGKQYPPWCFEEKAMLQYVSEAGVAFRLPEAEEKELLMQLPPGCTAAEGVSTRARHRMLGNAWHGGVARALLTAILASAVLPAVTRETPQRLSPWGGSRLDAIKLWCWAANIEYGAPDRAPLMGRTRILPDVGDPVLHMRAARDLNHPLLTPLPCEDAVRFVLTLQGELGPDVVRWRTELINEIRELASTLTVETTGWFRGLPDHLKLTYSEANGTGVTQIPLFSALLDTINYPQRDQLVEDLSLGFELVGSLHRGVGWALRPPTQDKPMSYAELCAVNITNMQEAMGARRPDKHASEILTELVRERRLGRVSGPFQAPLAWGKRAVGLPPDLQDELDPPGGMLPSPEGPMAAAMAFGIEQVSSEGKLKVRRGDDWLRSGHNEAAQALDRPYHHTVDAHAAAAQALHANGASEISIWGHDHEGAYRQFGPRHPELMYVVVPTSRGPVIFKHNALNFGSKGAVWAYGRVGDALVAVARLLLAMLVFHFVDDYTGVERAETAPSAFGSFGDLNACCGFTVKKAKAQPPSCEMKDLGAIVGLAPDGIRIAQCPLRAKAQRRALKEVCESNELSPTLAGRLAGKGSYLATQVNGRVGRAALKPLFGRQHTSTPNRKLTHALRAGCVSLMHILDWAPPRFVPFAPSTSKAPVLLADAFFQVGGARWNVGDSDMPAVWPAESLDDCANGLGAVLLPVDGSRPEYFASSVPTEVLAAFATRRQFIFFLEAVAQCLPAWHWAQRLAGGPAGAFVSFCDNSSAQGALVKGYTADPPCNVLIALYWSSMAVLGAAPWFERVSSKDNIADAVSRFDFTEAESQGWLRVHPPLDKVWEVLLRAVRDLDYGSLGAARAVLKAAAHTAC